MGSSERQHTDEVGVTSVCTHPRPEEADRSAKTQVQRVLDGAGNRAHRGTESAVLSAERGCGRPGRDGRRRSSGGPESRR